MEHQNWNSPAASSPHDTWMIPITITKGFIYSSKFELTIEINHYGWLLATFPLLLKQKLLNILWETIHLPFLAMWFVED